MWVWFIYRYSILIITHLNAIDDCKLVPHTHYWKTRKTKSETQILIAIEGIILTHTKALKIALFLHIFYTESSLRLAASDSIKFYVSLLHN